MPNGIWLTRKLRQEMGLDERIVVVYSTGAGEYVALDTASVNADGECPVVVCVPMAVRRGQEEIIAADFGAFFLDRVEDALSDG